MNASRKARAEEIFLDALDLAADDRATYLTGRCGGDVKLLHEIRLLIRAHESRGILDFRIRVPPGPPGKMPPSRR